MTVSVYKVCTAWSTKPCYSCCSACVMA